MLRFLHLSAAAFFLSSSAIAAEPIYLTSSTRLEPFGLDDSYTFVAPYFTNASTALSVSITKLSSSSSSNTAPSQSKQTSPSITHAEWKPIKDASGQITAGQITLKVSCDLTSVLTPNKDSVTIESSKPQGYNNTFLVTGRDAGSVELKAGPDNPGVYRGGGSIPDTFCAAQSTSDSYSILFSPVMVPADRGYLYLRRNAFFADTVNVSVDNNGMLSSSDSSSAQQVTAILTELAQTAGLFLPLHIEATSLEKKVAAPPPDPRKACYTAISDLLKSGPFYKIKNVGKKELAQKTYAWSIPISSNPKVSITFLLEHSPIYSDFEGFHRNEIEDGGRAETILTHSGVVAFLPVPARASIRCDVPGAGSAYLSAPTIISLYAQRQFIDPQRDFLTNPQDTLTFNAGVITAHKYTDQSPAKTVVDTITAPIRALIPSMSVQQTTSVQSQAGKPDLVTNSTQSTTSQPKTQ